jgi:hypothetical protein
MSNTPANPPVVKEFQFFSDSRYVTIVFEDETTIEFKGEENYHKARTATAHGRHADQAMLELTDAEGKPVAMIVKKEVAVEAFEA